MKTLKTTLLISALTLLITSCTDLNSEDLVPETKKQNTELVTSFTDLTNNGGTTNNDGSGNNLDTGGDGSDGSDGDGDGSKGN